MKKITQWQSIGKIVRPVWLVSLPWLVTACSTTYQQPINPPSSIPTQAQLPKPTQLTLALGQNRFIADKQLNITFTQLLNDNRCPQRVQCIWAGNASVAIEVMSTTSRPQTLTLSIGDLRGEQTQSQRFANYAIRLDNVENIAMPNNTSMSPQLLTPQVTLSIFPIQ